MLANLLMAAALASTGVPTIERTASTARHGPLLALKVVGRVAAEADGRLRRQWPGTYVDAAFRGRGVLFEVGAGEAALHVSVDGGPPAALVTSTPGTYRLVGLADGPHRLRIQVVSESQAGPTELGPVWAAEGGAAAAAIPPARREIEAVGDSHTVGYGNTSPTQTCTEAQVWASTDVSQSPGAQLARRYGADIQINAISGRGVVRNYNGFAAPTLPQAYPQTLLVPSRAYRDPHWRPQILVVALGTNDFSTQLHAGERWADRTALHADFEATYARFLASLRAEHPGALLVVWATGKAEGEVAREAGRVVEALRAGGDKRIRFVEVQDLDFSACNSHPSVADDSRISAALAKVIDGEPGVWGDGGR